MCDIKNWQEIIKQLPDFHQECFYKQWNKSYFECDKCKSKLPNHKLFRLDSKSPICKECKGKTTFINSRNWKLFESLVPVGFKFCFGCNLLLPEDIEHFTKNGDKLYSKCKLCRGLKKFGTHQTGINTKLRKENKKKCKYCLTIKDIENFPKVRNTQVVNAEYCFDCSYIFKEKEKERRSSPKYYAMKSNYDKSYYKTNREARLKYHLTWRQTPRGLQVNSSLSQKRIAKKLKLPSDFTVEQWNMCLEYFNGECAYCGMSLENHLKVFNKQLAKEHVIPVNSGGAYSDYNIVPSCFSCNSKKNTKDLETFFESENFFVLERYLKIIDYILLVA